MVQYHPMSNNYGSKFLVFQFPLCYGLSTRTGSSNLNFYERLWIHLCKVFGIWSWTSFIFRSKCHHPLQKKCDMDWQKKWRFVIWVSQNEVMNLILTSFTVSHPPFFILRKMEAHWVFLAGQPPTKTRENDRQASGRMDRCAPLVPETTKNTTKKKE